MWLPSIVQIVFIFLFFQPKLLERRWIRRGLLILSVGFTALHAVWMNADPFASLWFLAVIVISYWMSSKALRWVFANRANVVKDIHRLDEAEGFITGVVAQKTRDIAAIQTRIKRVSDIYENLKEMSGSMENLGIFINLSEMIIDNFDVSKIRLILLRFDEAQHVLIDKVYQVDASRLRFRKSGHAMMTEETMFQGEIYPSDVKLVETVRDKKTPVYWPPDLHPEDGGETPVGGETAAFPPGAGSFVAYPVRLDQGLDAILTIEGISKKDNNAVSILTDRFVSEFRRVRLYAHVERLATTDWLTNMYVRRYFFKRLEEEIGRSRRFHLQFSFLMIDIDDFKAVNDRYGHLVGDALLKKTAHIIKQNVREVDLVGRFGGEEFAAILLDTDTEGAMFVSQRIRKGIEAEKFAVYDEVIHQTVSIGLATFTSKIMDGSQIIEWADSALYQAKRQGKNRVCAYVN